MEFHKKLYELRKKSGISQEELADKLNVSRQTVSKWEMGDSTPDMEKLRGLSDYFQVSLDELVMGKEPVDVKPEVKQSFLRDVQEKLWTDANKRKLGRGFKVAAILLGILLTIDIVSMIIYFVMYGVPA